MLNEDINYGRIWESYKEAKTNILRQLKTLEELYTDNSTKFYSSMQEISKNFDVIDTIVLNLGAQNKSE